MSADLLTAGVSEKVARDPFWEHCQSEGLGRIHMEGVLRKVFGNDHDPLAWRTVTTREIEADLQVALRSARPEIQASQARVLTDRARQALAAALYERVDGQLRALTTEMFERTAGALQRIAADPEKCAALLNHLRSVSDNRERIANLEALGFDNDTARGLAVRLANPDMFDRLIQRGSGAIHSRRKPITLLEIGRTFGATAAELRQLSGRIRSDRGIHIFDLCPELARGLLARLPEESFLGEVFRSRLDQHALCRKLDRATGLAASLLVALGSGFLGGWGLAAKIAWTGGKAGASWAGNQRAWTLAKASAASGGMSPSDFRRAGGSYNREAVLSGAAVIGIGLPGAGGLIAGVSGALTTTEDPASAGGAELSLHHWIEQTAALPRRRVGAGSAR